MPYCVLRWCKNYSSRIKKDDGVTYHTFPSDELTRVKWISCVQAERSDNYWMPTKSSTICSAHFKEEDKYSTSKGYQRLKKSAVPVAVTEYVVRSASLTSIDDVHISDTDSMFDSPIEATFKTRVRKLTVDKQILQKNIKVLKNQNKRLKTRVLSMKNMLKVLKKKNFLLERQLTKANLKGTTEINKNI